MNALRSMVRYVAVALGPEWEVRLTPDEVFERPFARVVAATPVTSTPHGARHRILRQTFAVTAFPVDFRATAESAFVEAQRVQVLLDQAFSVGVDEWSFNSNRRHPLRVPLLDYSDVALGEAATDDDRIGYMRVIEPPALTSFSDPASDSAYVVTCNVRCEWSEFIGVPPGPPVEEVEVGYKP